MPVKLTKAEITQATLFAYKLPFKDSVQFKQYKLSSREGLILQLVDNLGRISFSEIAPLPGFSHEKLTEVKKELTQQLPKHFRQLSEYKSSYNSVQFALDNFISELTQLPTTEIDKIPLLQGTSEQVKAQYLKLNKPNLIKLKVAREQIENDIECFQTLCELNPKLKIRCDANQAWNRQQATLFFTSINPLRLDYIEEPTADYTTNIELAEQYQVPLGLDESLQQTNFSYQAHPCIKAFIIKPTIIGSKEKIDYLVSIAKQHNINISFSASFESAVGLQQLIQLSAHYRQQKSNQHIVISLGIDTLKYFSSNLLVDFQRIKQDIQQLEVLWTSH